MKYLLVPITDIQRLEQSRIDLLKLLEASEQLNMVTMTKITNPIWQITHKKYDALEYNK